jgi:hypothetical protein
MRTGRTVVVTWRVAGFERARRRAKDAGEHKRHGENGNQSGGHPDADRIPLST